MMIRTISSNATARGVFSLVLTNRRLNHSSLYVKGGLRSQKATFVVDPSVDFDELFTNEDKLIQNLKARNCPQFDFQRMREGWGRFKELQIKINTLNERRQTAAAHIASAKQKEESAPDTVNALIENVKKIKLESKQFTDELFTLEDTIIIPLLGLPNSLSDSAPVVSDQVISFFKPKPENSELRVDTSLVEESSSGPNAFYLHGRLAVLELALIDFFEQELNSSGSFLQVSNSDLCKHVVIEGCGLKSRQDQLIEIKTPDGEQDHLGNMIFLTGGASLPAFASAQTRQIWRTTSQDTNFRLFSIGRSYKQSDNKDILHSVQSTNVSFCILTATGNCGVEFEMTLSLIESVLQKLDMHYRVVSVKASWLDYSESRRVEIQFWSGRLSEYVTVASVSDTGEYVSRRLLMQYKQAKNPNRKVLNEDAHFFSLIHGSVANCTRLIALIAENMRESGDLIIPNVLQPLMLDN